jgi:two-component system chemotaxis sensor kinase CheA
MFADRESIMSYQLIYDGIQESILVVDQDGLVRYGNHAASLLLDVTQKRLASGRPLDSIVELNPNPLIFDTGLTAVKEETKISEVLFKLSSGQSGWVQLAMQPQPDFLTREVGVGDRWIVSMRDVTLERTLHTKYRGELDQKESVISDLREARTKLEEYSHGLETKVQERTAELSELNRLFKTILDSLGQGILVFDVNGICLQVFSKACETLFKVKPSRLPIEEVLGLKDKEKNNFSTWRASVFEDRIDFEDMIPLALKTIDTATDLTLSLDYAAMRDENNVLKGVVVAATDRTRERQALRRVEEERLFVEKILRLAKNRNAFRMFIREARMRFRGFSTSSDKSLDEILREIHTIKGGAASFSLQTLVTACHDLEDVVASTSEIHRQNLNQTLLERGPILLRILDDEVTRLSQVFGPIDDTGSDRTIEVSLATMLGWSLDLLSARDLSEAHAIGDVIRRVALEKPVAPAFEHFSISLKDLAKRQGKEIESFVIEGGNLRAPLEHFQSLFSSLVHALRNAVYHGIESPDERKRLKKHEGGTIVIRFSRYEGLNEDNRSWLRIDLSDDGRGIDPDVIRKKLKQMGRAEYQSLSDSELIQAVFIDQFSTNDTIDTIAGRGVGLSAIEVEAHRLGGQASIKSTKGQGTTLTVRVPFPSAWSEYERKILGAA